MRARPPVRPRRRSGARWGLALVLAIVAVWAFARLRPAPRPGRTSTPADSVATLDPALAYERGVGLAREGRATEALPFLRRASEAAPDRWDLLAAYGTALHNASFEQTSHHGVPAPLARSSWERTRLALAALAALDRAERLAATPEDRERVARRRAVLLANWGFTRDAASAFAVTGATGAANKADTAVAR